MKIRDIKGRFTAKAGSMIQNHRKIVTTVVIIGAIGVCNSLVYGVNFYESHAISPVVSYITKAKSVFASTTYVATSTPVEKGQPGEVLNKQLEALVESRTQVMMQDPSNLKEYHDKIYKKVMNGVNTLSSSLY